MTFKGRRPIKPRRWAPDLDLDGPNRAKDRVFHHRGHRGPRWGFQAMRRPISTISTFESSLVMGGLDPALPATLYIIEIDGYFVGSPLARSAGMTAPVAHIKYHRSHSAICWHDLPNRLDRTNSRAVFQPSLAHPGSNRAPLNRKRHKSQYNQHSGLSLSDLVRPSLAAQNREIVPFAILGSSPRRTILIGRCPLGGPDSGVAHGTASSSAGRFPLGHPAARVEGRFSVSPALESGGCSVP